LKKIFVVDNDLAMCELMTMAFRHRGHEIVACCSPKIVREALENGQCAALLMDYHLGMGESGVGYVRAWSSQFGLPPTWIVTGTPGAEDLREVEALPGFMAVISKPFAILDLVAAVLAAVVPSAASAPALEREAGS
jgi:DNA-binding response OmpR family regulator